MTKTQNTAWDTKEEASFKPWEDRDSWQPIAVQLFSENTDFTCDGGKCYGIVADGYGGETLPFQMLRVQWPNKKGRACFGYVVRDSRSEEVVAVIHQGGGWSWWFKLKDEPEGLQKLRHDGGWVGENHMASTMNSVMYWHLKP